MEFPLTDIQELFKSCNAIYFEGKLSNVDVKWSNRMYKDAGTCFNDDGKFSIYLSAPLLKVKSRDYIKSTLLHEMIHAYVDQYCEENDDHGPNFLRIMDKINKTGENVEIYHDLEDTTHQYKKYWWRCNGPCRSKPPFFGIIKRERNKVPGPVEFWFRIHQNLCGGEFIKVKEPFGFKSGSKEISGEIGYSEIRIDKSVTVDMEHLNLSNTENRRETTEKPSTSKQEQGPGGLTDTATIECPVFDTEIPPSEYSDHTYICTTLDENGMGSDADLIGTSSQELKLKIKWANKKIKEKEEVEKVKCPNCRALIETTQFREHFNNCVDSEKYTFVKGKEKLVKMADCPNCGYEYLLQKISRHIDECLLTRKV